VPVLCATQVRSLMVVLNIRLRVFAFGFIVAALATNRGAFAQTPATSEKPLNFETRAELEAQARIAEAKQDKGETYLIRWRLEHGDFQTGDRIIIRFIRGAGGSTDTLTVGAGKQLQLPQVGDFSLDGVLRSELVPKLTAYMSKYMRDPVVQARPLVRIGVIGNVARPGFYYAPPDVPISDVLMGAGGPTSIADLERVSVRRDGEVIIDEKNTYVALTNGMSMDLLHMVAGDQISVGKQRQIPWGMILPVVTTVIGLGIAYGTR
jgi:hypothetical protein